MQQTTRWRSSKKLSLCASQHQPDTNCCSSSALDYTWHMTAGWQEKLPCLVCRHPSIVSPSANITCFSDMLTCPLADEPNPILASESRGMRWYLDNTPERLRAKPESKPLRLTVQTADFGPRTALKVVDQLREPILAGKLKSGDEIRSALKASIVSILSSR